MPFARSCFFIARRLGSSGRSPKTSILFLHFGQPKNAFYAKDFLNRVATDYYGVPRQLSNFIPSSFHLTKKIKASVDEYDHQEKIEDTVGRLVSSIESSLERLVPEYGPITCHYSFPYDSILEKEIHKIYSSGTNHLILFPLYSHFSCSQAGLLLNSAAKILGTTMKATRVNGNAIESSRFVPNSEISLDLSTIHRWIYHPSVTDFWADQLNQRKDDYEAIVFSSPTMRGFGREEYVRSVWSSCDKVMQKVEKNVPWRLGFYNSWNETDFPLKDSLNSQVRRLNGKQHIGKRVAVVPITELFPTFDTFSVLPRLISKESSAFVVSPPSSSEIIIHGMAEVLKNHLLGRRDVQLEQFCCGCYKKDCEYTRLLLA